MSDECKHGSLRRLCEICERADEIERLWEQLRHELRISIIDAAVNEAKANDLRDRVAELEMELNPDPEAHLMGWKDDEDE